MHNRILKLTATAGATALLAGLGTVAATSASAAATAPAATATHVVPASTPVATHPSAPDWWGWWWCAGYPYPVTVSIPGLLCIHL
ncbi:MAG: hypothetical protein HOW97_36610 [Catenulispora sp.]|nr:hypothetical protein [Catenulispora sp.]